MSPSHDPFCGNCGYQLGGLVDSSKCPECGLPLVDVLSRSGQWGKRYRSKATLFGLPVIDYAFGPRPGEPVGKPRGLIALGDAPVGVLAIGGMARGVVACGGVAIGVVTFGGVSLGVLAAIGGVAVGALAYGGVSIGLLASGGLALGIMATGGMPVGWFAAGGAPISPNPMGPGVNSAAANTAFRRFAWFFGTGNISAMLQPLICIGGMWLSGAAGAGLLAVMGSMRDKDEECEGTFPPS